MPEHIECGGAIYVGRKERYGIPFHIRTRAKLKTIVDLQNIQTASNPKTPQKNWYKE
jgi:hypothetical protein